MAKKDDDGIWVWFAAAAVLLFGLGSKGAGGGQVGDDKPDPGPGGDYDPDDLDDIGPIQVVVATGDLDEPGGVKPPKLDPIFPGVEVPKKPGDPGGPTPGQIDDWIKSYPTPGTFYQVRGGVGDNFTGHKGVATRLARSALFLAAKNVGGLSDSDANEWAGNRDGYQNARKPVTQLIACTPWNDALYATYAFGAQSLAGQQGRAIRMMPNSAPNANLIRGGEAPIRNIRMCAPGDSASCSTSPVNGAYRGFELLWLTDFDYEILWASGGTDFRPGGAWPDGSSKMQPPPKIWALGITDLTDAGVGSWGCAPWQEAIPSG